MGLTTVPQTGPTRGSVPEAAPLDESIRSIAVIPARGGSKRIPRKNIREFSGLPLLVWAIRAARDSGAFDRIIVSTDDSEIAGVARDYGAEVPFLRSSDLSDDFTPTVDVIADALQRVQETSRQNVACCVYPAAVFVSASDIRNGRALLERERNRVDYVATVVRFAHPIQRAMTLTEDKALTFIAPHEASARTQDLPPRWHDAGQFYWGKCEAWMALTPILPNAAGYELPSWRVEDIDSENDWVRAQFLHRFLRESGGSKEPA